MDPTTTALATAITASGSGGIGTLLVLIFLAMIPLVVKFWNWSKETSAQGILYQQLSEMVQKQRTELDAMYTQRTTMQEQVFELKSKVEKLEGYESTAEILKQKLDQKDQIIAERDAKISSLIGEMLSMKDRIHELELRLAKDEVHFLSENKNAR